MQDDALHDREPDPDGDFDQDEVPEAGSTDPPVEVKVMVGDGIEKVLPELVEIHCTPPAADAGKFRGRVGFAPDFAAPPTPCRSRRKVEVRLRQLVSQANRR